MDCEGCGKELNPIVIIMCGKGPMICLDCVRARAKTAQTHRCTCGKKRRENPELHRSGSRMWHTCLRCLGTTRQLS